VTGQWLWAWRARPADSYTPGPEVDVVAAWRNLVEALAEERYARGWGLRRLAAEAGVSFSVVNDVDQGSSWSRLGTVEAIASALGYRLEVDAEPGHGVVDGLIRQARRQHRREGTTLRQLAEYAGVRPNTLYELQDTVAGGSVRTALVLVQQLGTQLVPRQDTGQAA